jgi:predicted RNase H-like nuclease (RuvC/YqgF family)
MATSVKKRIRRRPSWLSPMWRDIDSLRRQNALSRQQNEELRKENEAIKRETEQIDQEIEQIEQETEQIEQEIEQIEQETVILRRQNKALAFLESKDFDKMVRELAGPGDGDARHPLDRVDVCLLCEKLVEHGCDERDLPFLLDALELEDGLAVANYRKGRVSPWKTMSLAVQEASRDNPIAWTADGELATESIHNLFNNLKEHPKEIRHDKNLLGSDV